MGFRNNIRIQKILLTIVFSALVSISPGWTTPNDSIPQTSTILSLDSANRFLSIKRIFILGNKITRDHIIHRELSFRTGDLIHSSDLTGLLELDRKKLMNTRLFNFVQLRAVTFGEDEIDILIEVSERWYTFPTPILELADRNFNEWYRTYDADFKRVNYGLRMYHYNSRGRNETLRLVLQSGFYRRFELTYRIPYLDRNQKQGLIFDFAHQATRNVPVQTIDHKLVFLNSDRILRKVTGGGLTYTFRNTFYLIHALRAEYYHTRIADEVTGVQEGYYLNDARTQQRLDHLNYTIAYDRRDYNGYPLEGKVFIASVGASGLLSRSYVKKQEVSVNASWFLPVGKGYYFSANGILYGSTPDNIPYYNYSSAGYRRQILRGYELYVIEGPYQALAKTTFKKRLFARNYHWASMPLEQFQHVPLQVYIKAYGDAGYVRSYPGYTNSLRLNNRLLAGYGMGLDIVGAYDMVLRLEYSFNNQGDQGFFLNIKREF